MLGGVELWKLGRHAICRTGTNESLRWLALYAQASLSPDRSAAPLRCTGRFPISCWPIVYLITLPYLDVGDAVARMGFDRALASPPMAWRRGRGVGAARGISPLSLHWGIVRLGRDRNVTCCTRWERRFLPSSSTA